METVKFPMTDNADAPFVENGTVAKDIFFNVNV